MTLDDRPTHPADLAYVLKFRLDSAPDRDLWVGRIEHLDSGRRHNFTSRDDLLAWLAHDRLQTDAQAHPSDTRPPTTDGGGLPDRFPTDR